MKYSYYSPLASIFFSFGMICFSVSVILNITSLPLLSVEIIVMDLLFFFFKLLRVLWISCISFSLSLFQYFSLVPPLILDLSLFLSHSSHKHFVSTMLLLIFILLWTQPLLILVLRNTEILMFILKLKGIHEACFWSDLSCLFPPSKRKSYLL